MIPQESLFRVRLNQPEAMNSAAAAVSRNGAQTFVSRYVAKVLQEACSQQRICVDLGCVAGRHVLLVPNPKGSM